jgi:carboxyl-terminal processing protease
MAALQKSEETLLDKNQKEIKKLILDEIIIRYQYKEGLYEFNTKNNIEISEANAILANPIEYNKILQ